jgi:hypothetical protein
MWVATPLLLLLALLGSAQVWAVPSFARQTGMPCSQCHTMSFGPALTAYGRQFKLNGYVWGDADDPMPLALMIQGGFTYTAKAQPDPPAAHFATNDNLSVDQVSLFVATRVTEHLGVFAQGTYSGEDRHTAWDNLDVRYARALKFGGTDAIVGISVNNNPTVQDLWNSTPAWGFPYISSALAPTPAASTLIEGLGQTVLGVTAYTMIHDRLYLEAGVYRGLSDRWLSNTGLTADDNPNINGVAPYWRAALQFDQDPHYFSAGMFGIEAKLQPDPTVAGTDRYTDFGFDATYQYTAGDVGVAVNATYIHEDQSLGASFAAGGSSSASNHLDSAKIDASLNYRQTWSASTQLFDISGGTDPTLYTPEPLSGSNSGSPDSRGYILQLEWVPFGKMDSFGRPWVNVRTGIQYTGYLRFNGGAANYDGFGRSASQNNTVFVYLWMAL